jgi:predicted RNA-binding protein with TRAM domain
VLSLGSGLRLAICMKAPRNFHPEPFAYHEEVEVLIEDLTNLGQGVGRIDGWVVFVPFTLPGERVRARIWRNKKQYSEADLLEVQQAFTGTPRALLSLVWHLRGLSVSALQLQCPAGVETLAD